MEDMRLHKLFGGTIEMLFPQRMIDVSDLRQVPDNQEVFTDAAQHQTLIVEVLVSELNLLISLPRCPHNRLNSEVEVDVPFLE